MAESEKDHLSTQLREVFPYEGRIHENRAFRIRVSAERDEYLAALPLNIPFWEATAHQIRLSNCLTALSYPLFRRVLAGHIYYMLLDPEELDVGYDHFYYLMIIGKKDPQDAKDIKKMYFQEALNHDQRWLVQDFLHYELANWGDSDLIPNARLALDSGWANFDW